MDLGVATDVKAVATQGRNAYAQWVTSYKIGYGNDAINFLVYSESGSNADKVWLEFAIPEITFGGEGGGGGGGKNGTAM